MRTLESTFAHVTASKFCMHRGWFAMHYPEQKLRRGEAAAAAEVVEEEEEEVARKL